MVPERFNAASFFIDRHLAEGRGGEAIFRFGGRPVTYAELAARIHLLITTSPEEAELFLHELALPAPSPR